MMNKKIIWIIVIILLVAVILGIKNLQNSSNSQRNIKIGVIMPFSSGSGGDLSVFSNNVMHGMEVALSQSGIATSSIEIIPEDTAGFTTSGALSAFRKAVEQDHVDIVFGPFGPAQVLTVAPTISSSTPLTVIAVSNCDERFKAYPTLFCLYPGISDQVNHQIEFMKFKGWKSAYFFTENSELGLLVESFLKQGGVNLLGTEKIVPNQTKDFRTIIAKMVAAKPDVILAALAPNEGFIMLRQYLALSKGIPLYIGTDVNKNQVKDIFGQKVDNTFFAARMSEAYDSAFIDEFKTRYGNDPDYFSALGHSAATTLFDAIKDVKGNLTLLPKSLVGRSVETSAVKGFIFKADRTVSVPLHSYSFKNGDFVEIR